MQVEIGALVHKDCGHQVLEVLQGIEGVAATYIEAGRSNDLFDDRQFGEFGEASIITVIADEAHKEAVFDQLHRACGLEKSARGLIYMTEPVLRCSL
ncbi:MAG: hypothetical protein ISP92_03640 [Pseudomonadales bacterium]|jgi:hypothetical protein|nr:hypothetical protein [Pseudomonadales bacterium]MDA0760589.1 hypothetical protein [Pseudomonadota bacterium]MDA0956899.1 hypothetical protein [Pseudomonadota bacterium]